MFRKAVHITYKMARRIAIGIVGSTVLLLGFVMIVTPGPALVVIPVGLAILSIEFTWARLWLKKVRTRLSEQAASTRARRAERQRERVNNDSGRNGHP